MRPSRALLLILPLCAVALTGGWWLSRGESDDVANAPHWVDENQCRQCHAPQFRDWQQSHHPLAMRLPADGTVRGDFNDAIFRSDRETTRFFRDGDTFQVSTPNADGQPETFPVAYTFGWAPLQQYLLALDDGRLQALGVAWDTAQQRWFHLYDGEGVDAHHPLHWQQPAQNANTQCIECHTTDFRTGFDEATQRFDSQWHSLGVGCQGCHGPAADHLRWTNALNETPDTTPGKGFARQLDQAAQQLDTCGTCHSRRTPLGTPTRSAVLQDDYLLSQLTADLYEVDGKIQGEVFEYGSFLQSRMHQAGVVCADCHNPHSGQLRAPDNAVCTQCHNPAATPVRAAIRGTHLAAKDYDSPAHHHHAPGSPGAACKACHMPGKTYMGNDLRHDHSFSSPDPEQALALGHSDACLGCHENSDTDTLLTHFRQWYPAHQPRDGGYARALFKARHGDAGAAEALLTQLSRDDLPGLRRAALIAELPAYPSRAAQQAVFAALKHADPSVRRAAIEALPPGMQSELPGLLNDPVRAVRLGAAEQWLSLADQQGMSLPADALSEYEQVQQQLLANAEAHTNLANLYRLTGRDEQVTPALHAALQRNPRFVPAIVLLAQWQAAQGDVDGSRRQLIQALRDQPGNAVLHHAYGLASIRAGQLQEGVRALEKAHALAPDNDTYAYVLAVAWHDTGQRPRALQLLREQLARHPASRPLRLALYQYLPHGPEQDALLQTLTQQNPQDPLLNTPH
jgi:tetratricopeptide (TPR) repeat protein